MRITFVLPGPARKPVGGYRVIYEYADRLAARGYQVSVVHSITVPHMRYKTPLPVRSIGHRLLRSHVPKWFGFRSTVDLRLVPEIVDEHIPDADAVVATWWGTAYAVAELSRSKGAKFYLIQGYEVWDWDEAMVHESYKLGLSNIVIARWLKGAVEQCGGEVAALVHNGMDFHLFELSIPIESRDPLSVAMMYHEGAHKGSGNGISALELARKRFPELEATLFSVYPKPGSFPYWIKFVHNPPQAELIGIYNRHAVFVSPSLTEGWGLPHTESMACGCALVATNVGGVRDYAVHEQTALLSPPKNPQALGENIIRLLADNDLRVRLAKSGHEVIQHFTWDRAVTAFERCLSENI